MSFSLPLFYQHFVHKEQHTIFRFSAAHVNNQFMDYPNSLGFIFQIPQNATLIELFDKYFQVFLQNIKACILKGKSLPLNYSITEIRDLTVIPYLEQEFILCTQQKPMDVSGPLIRQEASLLFYYPSSPTIYTSFKFQGLSN